MVGTLPHLSSSGSWSEADEWMCAVAWQLPVNLSGLRFRPQESPGQSQYHKNVRQHVARVSERLRVQLARNQWSEVHTNIVQTSSASAKSKCALLAQRLQSPGPPVHLMLDRIQLTNHRAAVASFLCSDWFLAQHAKNYFARNLLPHSTSQIERARDAGAEENTLCIACWHKRREPFLESEFHVLCVCPEYAAARQDFVAAGARLDTNADVIAALSSNSKDGAERLGKLLARMRQIRRRLKLDMERHSEAFARKNFACRRAAWRLKKRASCRHGVLFAETPPHGCKCMSVESSSEADWRHARYMPALDHELKCIIAVPFQSENFTRLATLQHQARQMGW